MKRNLRRAVSTVLALLMLLSVLQFTAVTSASAETAYENYALETVQGGAILHCFNWSYNNIKAKLPDIAAAGYTAVQTSPVQRPKDYNSSWTDTPNQWWKLYQPLGLSIAANNTSWLGTKAQLTSLCTEAEKYNIKVVVDIVANHLANGGTDGGTYDYINSAIESDLKNRNYYHTVNNRTSDTSRYTMTQYHLGMPDLNTANTYVQERTLGLLTECIDCGVDGFRFDAAKHIELPTDDSSIASQFWPTVLNGATEYAYQNGYDEPFYYGEILGGAGTDISNYTTYMAVTDNQTGDRALDKAYWTAASELADGTYMKGASANKSVLWVESHDTYMGNSGSAWVSNTKDVESHVLNKAWAIVGARADSTALFFARPNSTMGAASTDTNWKSTAVTEVNKFKTHFDGTNEYLSSSGNSAYIERGTKGVVISKLDGAGSVNLTAHQMASGTYTDQITGNTFTVANGKISGTVGSTGVAVVYNADDDVLSYITEPTLYLKPNSNWASESARFAMYVYNSVTGATAWVNMTSDGSGYYSANVPSGNWTNVIFCRMNPANATNSWDNKWNQTSDLFPDSGTNCYTVASGAWDEGNGSWSLYGNSGGTSESQATSETQATSEEQASSETQPSDTYTIYAINNAGWSKVAVHYWGDGETNWPGADMTSISGTKVYSFQIPKNVSGLVFTNGASSSTKQTGDITTGITDGAIWTIGSASSNNYPCSTAPDYYLVGTMNEWSKNDNYKFSIVGSDSGKLEYKLSGVQLDANAELKVRSSSDSWYPSGSNHTVSEAGVYDIYFRPNGDGDSNWLSDSNNSSKRYVYLKNVTPRTITWKDGDGNTLKTETVANGETPVYSGATPTKTATAQYTYTFNNTWSPAVTAATADATYTAQFTENVRTFTVTWKNYDGTVLETDTDVAYGSSPSYNGQTPTRESEGATTYAFSGWSPQITSETTITEDTTYTARFGTNTKTYTIRWFDGDGNLLKTESCIEGITPQYFGDTPTKTADAQYTYTFNNTWDPVLVAADRDTDYVAQFGSTVNKYTVTWKDGNGDILKTEEVEYGLTPSYTGTTPRKDSDGTYNYTFNNTWSPAITSVTGNATYTAQFDAAAIPDINVYATNVVDWSDVYLYYWTDFGDNAWPGEKMTADSDNFIMSASIPANAKGIVFNNGNSGSMKQTVDVASGIQDGARWAILDEKDSTETSKYKVHAVPTYYLVGTMTDWSTDNAAAFTPHKASEKVEEYKLTTTLTSGSEIKVYSSGDAWYPSGENNNYSITADGNYEILFRPNADGSSTWHENVFYVKNVTPYTITWKDGDGNTLKTDTVTHGDTPSYSGAAPTKTEDDDYTYTFNNTWSPAITAATADTTYTAAFTAVPKIKTINYTYNVYNESTESKVAKTISKSISYTNMTAAQLIELNMPYIKSAYLEYGAYTYTANGTTLNVTISDTAKKYTVTLDGNEVGEYTYLQTATLTSDVEKAFVVDGKVMYVGTSYSFYVCKDTDVTLDNVTEKAEYANISLNTITIADGKVSLDLLATANVGEGSFKRMGVAFALSEKEADTIRQSVQQFETGDGTDKVNNIAVHNSTVDYANQSGQYQFRYAPYFSITSAKERTIYFYTYVVTDDGIIVSDAAQYDMSNLLA